MAHMHRKNTHFFLDVFSLLFFNSCAKSEKKNWHNMKKTYFNMLVEGNRCKGKHQKKDIEVRQ